MNKIMMAMCVAGAAMAMGGCKSTNVDEWRSDLKTELCPAKFKPVYEVMQDKGIVKGEASETYSWWGFVGEGPDTFANELGGPISLRVGLKEAAFEDACAKAGCTILLAPRFTVYKRKGILGFDGECKVTVEGVPARLVGAEEVKCEMPRKEPGKCCCPCPPPPCRPCPPPCQKPPCPPPAQPEPQA